MKNVLIRILFLRFHSLWVTIWQTKIKTKPVEYQ